MSELMKALVDFLQAQGVDGTVVLGGVTFDYLSLVVGGIIGFILGALT